MQYNNIIYHLTTGDCVFIDCRNQYSHTTSSDNLWKVSWVHFNGPTIENIYLKYKARGVKTVFHPEKIAEYKELLSSLYTTAKLSSYVRDIEINDLLSKVLVLLMEDSWNPENSKIQGKEQKWPELESISTEISKRRLPLAVWLISS